MDTGIYQLPGILDRENKSLLEMYENFQAIDEVYTKSLIAMGINAPFIASVSSNTNISLSNINPISTT